MSITVIIISACLSGQPAVCKEFKAEMAETVTTYQCFMNIPQQVAMWSQQNPGWQFTRGTCKTQEQAADGRYINEKSIN